MITLDQFISNISKFQMKDIKQEIVDIFEPILFQIVLYTRPDTGRARREIGEKFVQYAKPSEKRI